MTAPSCPSVFNLIVRFKDKTSELIFWIAPNTSDTQLQRASYFPGDCLLLRRRSRKTNVLSFSERQNSRLLMFSFLPTESFRSFLHMFRNLDLSLLAFRFSHRLFACAFRRWRFVARSNVADRLFFLRGSVARTAARMIAGGRGGVTAAAAGDGLFVVFEKLRHQSSPGHCFVHSQDCRDLSEVFRGILTEIIQCLRNEDPFEDTFVHFVGCRFVLGLFERFLQIGAFILLGDGRIGDVVKQLLHRQHRFQCVTLSKEVRDVATIETKEFQGIGMRLFHGLRDIDDVQLVVHIE